MGKTQEGTLAEAFLKRRDLSQYLLESHVKILNGLNEYAFEDWQKLLGCLLAPNLGIPDSNGTEEGSKLIRWSVEQTAYPENMGKLLSLFEHSLFLMKSSEQNTSKKAASGKCDELFNEGFKEIVAISESKQYPSGTFSQYLDILLGLKQWNSSGYVTGKLYLSQITLCNAFLSKGYDVTPLKNIISGIGNLHVTNNKRSFRGDYLMDYLERIESLEDVAAGRKNIQAMSDIVECFCGPGVLGRIQEQKQSVYAIGHSISEACLADTPSLIFRSTVCHLLTTNIWDTPENIILIFGNTSAQGKSAKKLKDAQQFLLAKETNQAQLASDKNVSFLDRMQKTYHKMRLASNYTNPSLVDIMQRIYQARGLPVEKAISSREVLELVCGVLGKQLASARAVPPAAYTNWGSTPQKP